MNSKPIETAGEMAPGDEAKPGTPGTGEMTCLDCHGSGSRGEQQCATCAGSGMIVKAIGGA